MTTTGERLVALSGLTGVSALTHFAAISLTGGVGASHPASLGTYVVMREEVMHVFASPRRSATGSAKTQEAPTSRATPKDRKRAYVFTGLDRCEVFTALEKVFVTGKQQSIVVSRPATPITINATK